MKKIFLIVFMVLLGLSLYYTLLGQPYAMNFDNILEFLSTAPSIDLSLIGDLIPQNNAIFNIPIFGGVLMLFSNVATILLFFGATLVQIGVFVVWLLGGLLFV